VLEVDFDRNGNAVSFRLKPRATTTPTSPVDQNPSASVIITTAVIMANQVAVQVSSSTVVLIIHPLPGPDS
jgi:hypothetical protein